MSNPLNNLRKSRKVPLPVNNYSRSPVGRNVPFRNPQYTMDEGKLLDEITGNLAADKLRRVDTRLPRLPDATQTSSPGNSPKSNGGATDSDLMSLMMTRLSQLEQKLQYERQQGSQKDKRIRVLEDKCKILQKARESTDLSRVADLEKKCLKLQKNVHQMETFLEDYGMVWLGEHGDSSDDLDDDLNDDDDDGGDDDGEILTKGDVNKLWSQDKSVGEFTVDYDLVLRNIEELNALAGEGIGKIEHRPDGARVKMPDSIPLTLYANGILMFSGPFRPLTDQTTQLCMRDFMDGYFPSELQNRYPDGVPFQVSDLREVHFKDRLSQVFEGQGQVLGGNTKPSRLVPSNLDKGRTRSAHRAVPVRETSQLPGPQMSMEQFLKKLPANVIRDGKIVDVRSGVGNTLTGSNGATDVTVVETSAVNDIRQNVDSARPSSTRHLTTLRVKNEAGDHVYILKMKYTDTLSDLKDYIDKQRPRHSGPYDIVSTFPKKTYSELTLTLEQSDLVPNATLHLQARKK